jgi:hypothetical protein
MKVGRTKKAHKKVDPSVGPRIKRARELIKMSQVRLAHLSDGKTRGVQNNESGTTMPNSRVIAALIAAGVNANWVLAEIGPPLLKDVTPAAGETPAGYQAITPSDVPAIVMALQRETGHDPGGAWTALLIGMLIDRSLTPAGARKVLDHLATFRPVAQDKAA